MTAYLLIIVTLMSIALLSLIPTLIFMILAIIKAFFDEKKSMKYLKMSSVFASIAMIACACLAPCCMIPLAYGEKTILDSTITETINLPNASVELISVDEKLTEVRIIESLDTAVGVRSYTNVEWKHSDTLNTLEIVKRNTSSVFAGIHLFDSKETVAILS